jgi:sugar phosphate isomerase/epimerase
VTYSRRDLAKLALAGLPLAVAEAARPKSRIKGVMIGAVTYSFRDRNLDEMLQAMNKIGLSYAELWQGHVEPKGSREELRKWRLSVSLDEFKKIRRKFDAAGIVLYAYNYGFRDDFSDAEIERGFQMTRALGVKRLTSTSTVSVAKRVSPFAEKYKIYVGMHNHSHLIPNEFARPEDFETAMTGTSRYIGVNLDIGHFVAAGFDPVEYVARHHDRIVTLHLKDRKRNQGPNVPFGEGDTPNREILRMLRDKKWPIPANIEYEYKGGDTVIEVKRCYDWCKRALA